MNEHNHDDDGDNALRWQLRALRRDAVPAHDLWPAIAARIERAPAATASRRASTSRWVPWALAASLLLGTGLAWKLQPVEQGAPAMRTAIAPTSPAKAQLLHREADAMTREYDAALFELQASGGRPAQLDPVAARELDRSATQIRAALARDPSARFLLDRLRSTYAQRLALAQRSLAT